MKTFRVCLASLVFLIGSCYCFAQEMKAEKYDNPQWVNMAYIKFKPMKKDAAMSVVENYFVKADQEAGIKPPTVFHFVTGEYDMLVIWEMPEGIETLNYKMTPDDVKWMESMANIAGGTEKAMEKLDEFSSYVDVWENTLARKE